MLFIEKSRKSFFSIFLPPYNIIPSKMLGLVNKIIKVNFPGPRSVFLGNFRRFFVDGVDVRLGHLFSPVKVNSPDFHPQVNVP
jgi:hypothetical protein